MAHLNNFIDKVDKKSVRVSWSLFDLQDHASDKII